MKAMADHNIVQNGNWVGMICTLLGLVYAKLTASDLASILTGLLAVCNLIIAWPKLKARLLQTFNRNNKKPPNDN